MPKENETPHQSDALEVMEKRLRELAFLHETSQVLTATLDLDKVLHAVIARVRDYFDVDAVSVALLDEEKEELIFRTAVGEAADAVIGMRLSLDQGIASWVVRTGEPTLVSNAHADERFYTGIDDTTDFYTQTMLVVPIQSAQDSHPIGVIEALNPASGAFDESAQSLLTAVANLAAIAIRNADLYERVHEAERRYESLFSKSILPVIVMDMNGVILDLNPQATKAFGQPREQMLNTQRRDLLGTKPSIWKDNMRQLQDGEHISLEKRISSNGETRIMETHMTKIDYGDAEAIQWIGHDITEQVELERVRDDLIHMIIHDLRNPLTNIISSLQMMHAAFTEQDETFPVTDVLKLAMRSSRKLNRLIDSLLDLRQLEAGQAELNKTPVRPQTLAKEAFELIKPLAIKKRQNLSTQFAPDLPKVFIDRDMMIRVLTNLLDNAVKFTPVEGNIALNITHQKNDILFTVSDDGPGIPLESQRHIFDRFARLENAKGVKGTGLGLAFCKLAVEAHGGHLWVESEPGEGSHFKFFLPLEVR